MNCRRRRTRSRATRGLVEQLDVARDLPLGVRPLHLHHDLLPARQAGAVHLPDRRRGDRLLLELLEDLLDREVELLLDDPADARERLGPGVVLKAAQLVQDVRRHDVGPGGQQLAELDEGRAQLVQHLAQPPAAVAGADRGVVGDGLLAAEGVAEPVAGGDLGDLAEAR
jgi:hypothetical protein